MGAVHPQANSVLVRAARAVRSPSPRIRLAARMYASGAVPTKNAAADAAGIDRAWFNTMSNHNEETRRIVGQIDQQIEDQSVEMSGILRALGRKALKRIHDLMYATDEQVAVRAAVDLADRSPETAKVHKIQDVTPHLSRQDAQTLAAALIEGARIKQRFGEEVKGDFVRVDDKVEVLPSGDQGNGTAPDGPKAPEDARLEGSGQDAEDAQDEEDVSAPE